MLQKNLENTEYDLGISDDGYLFKKEKKPVEELYNFTRGDDERKRIKKYFDMADREREELFKTYLLNKITESELKDYKQKELWDKEDRFNEKFYKRTARKFPFNFDDDSEDDFDTEERE